MYTIFLIPLGSIPATPSTRKRHEKDLLNQSLMNSHLIRIPSLTSLPARRLPGRNLQALSREAHRTLDAEILGFGTLKQLLADFLESTDFAAGEGDAEWIVSTTSPAEPFFLLSHRILWIV